MDKKRTILIPWDFTEKAENAYAHAVRIAKFTEHSIALVNIIKENGEKTQIENSFTEDRKRLLDKYGIEPKTLVREGDIFNTINNVAYEVNADFVIMGTHGSKGMQKVTGSWALKVIIGSLVPYIVVQGPPKNDKITKILMPIDYKREEKEKIKWAYQFVKYFKAKVYVIHPLAKDYWLKKGIIGNLKFLRNFFNGVKVDYEIHTVERTKNYTEETMKLADAIDADIILIITKKHLSWAGYIMGPQEQFFLNNSSRIPVMCINPKPGRLTGSFSSSG